jgi:hypothetical protein
MGRFHRAIGVIIFGGALIGATLLAATIALTSPGARSRPGDGVLFGIRKVVYDTQAPRRGWSWRRSVWPWSRRPASRSSNTGISNRDRRSDRPGDERACESCLRVGPCLALTSR